MQQRYQRNFDELRRIVADTERFFAEHRIDPELRTPADLCVEELFVNMVTYNTETREQVLLEMSPVEGGIEISLTDFDVERFDPTELPDVDVDVPLAQRSPGGLGLYLVMKMVDSIHYEYRNRQSRISFIIKVSRDHV